MRVSPSDPEISVIIVNWNGIALLDECLRSLDAQSFEGFEVILVDNGSTDGSAEWVARHHPRVRLLCLGSNTGFSAGNNAGLRIARGDYIGLLNNDTRVEPSWLAALHQRIRTDDRIAACDSKVLYYDRPHVIWSAGGIYTIAGSVQARWNQRVDGPGCEAPSDVFIAIACAAIYRRTAIDAIGFFDEDFINGYEDVDWSFRAHLSGFRIVNEPAARVYHKVSSTQVDNSHDFVRNGQRNVSATFLKNMPAPLLRKYWLLHLAYIMGSFMYFVKIGRAAAFAHAKLDVIRQLPAIWRKRRAIRTRQTVPSSSVDGLLERKWLSVKARKYRGDIGAAE